LVHRTSLAPPLLIEAPVPSEGKSEIIYMCARGINFDSFYDFSVGYWIFELLVFFFYFTYDDLLTPIWNDLSFCI
jgi:hypothetical protein